MINFFLVGGFNVEESQTPKALSKKALVLKCIESNYIDLFVKNGH